MGVINAHLCGEKTVLRVVSLTRTQHEFLAKQSPLGGGGGRWGSVSNLFPKAFPPCSKRKGPLKRGWSVSSLPQASYFNIIKLQEAIASESFFEFRPLCIQKLNLETGFTESDHVLEGEMKIGAQVKSVLLIGKSILL